MATYREALSELNEALLDDEPVTVDKDAQLQEFVGALAAAGGMAAIAGLGHLWAKHKEKQAAKNARLNDPDRIQLKQVLKNFSRDLNDVTGDLNRLGGKLNDISVFAIRREIVRKMLELDKSVKGIANSLRRVEGIASTTEETARSLPGISAPAAPRRRGRPKGALTGTGSRSKHRDDPKYRERRLTRAAREAASSR